MDCPFLQYLLYLKSTKAHRDKRERDRAIIICIISNNIILDQFILDIKIFYSCFKIHHLLYSTFQVEMSQPFFLLQNHFYLQRLIAEALSLIGF